MFVCVREKERSERTKQREDRTAYHSTGPVHFPVNRLRVEKSWFGTVASSGDGEEGRLKRTCGYLSVASGQLGPCALLSHRVCVNVLK